MKYVSVWISGTTFMAAMRFLGQRKYWLAATSFLVSAGNFYCGVYL